ncbi:hypothetical protein Curi_c02200 [Gottschalkia acidurici 9a]|uniref:Xylose isomerase-like TIM barrel domain-containing protein n=1 Tax=Gottschalkia acidurici (strain ATCC 7906 / DSM 604 / BCRC 14475 / CIP 104303 / KCTC 5404 / NCIMB 10678 / 9a) TaxID=1128398 RepID=K0AX24_GOTA9|nr:TIM barrel protein [Gottschalkia acidurici]AFS77300.1 hypothetical protein Curi_c02200 [Gottschalkia acidurici 9a]
MNPQLGICIHGVGVEYIQKHEYKRIQLCHKFSGAGDITSLLRMNKNHPIRVSYHAPVFHQVDPTLTYYLNSNFRLREATFEILEINLKMAQSLPTDYVIIHFTSNSMNENITDHELRHFANKSAERIDMLSRQYELPIYLEYTSYNNRFDKPEDFVEVVKDYDNLGICLDIGHLYMVCQTYGLDYFTELEKLLPYTKVMYLWNVTSKECMQEYGYIPVHPSQKSEDGWIDIEETLNLALNYNKDIYIIFEPNFEYKGEKYFEEGINWVNEIIGKSKLCKGEAL